MHGTAEPLSHAGSASGKMYFKKGKTLHGNEEGGKNCDEQPCAIMVKEGGGKEVLQVLEHFAACREPLGSRWIFPEGLYLLESPHGSSYF